MLTNPQPTPVRTLLQQNIFVIPPYQRDFEWKEEQIDQFFKELKPTNESTFFGSMIFLDTNQERDKKIVQEVVDGQQRLTTIFMTLGIIRNKLLEVTKEGFTPKKPLPQDIIAVDYAKKLHGEFINLNQTSYVSKSSENLDFELPDGESRFQGNNNIASLIHMHVTQSKPQPWPTRAAKGQRRTQGEKNLAKAATALEAKFDTSLGEFSDKPQKQEFLQTIGEKLLNDIFILPLHVRSRKDAYEVFISVNERGVRLGMTDLMKAELMKLNHVQNNGKDIETIEQIWKSMKANVGGNLDSFMRHTLSGYFQESLTKKEMMQRFMDGSEVTYKSEGKSFTKTIGLLNKGALRATQTLERFSIHYAEAAQSNRTTGNPELDPYLTLLNGLLDTHLIFSTQLLAHDQVQLKDKDKKEALKLALSLAGRWSLVAGNRQELEDIWIRAVQGLDHDPTGKLCLTELSRKMPSDERVLNAFFQQPQDEGQAKAVLRIIEDLVLGKGIKSTIPNITLEHIAPENPSGENQKYWYRAMGLDTPKKQKQDQDASQSNEYLAITARWGNLTLLSKPENSSLKDEPFEIKVNGRDQNKEKEKGYIHSKIHLNESICQIKPLIWNPKTIESRERELSKQVIKALPIV